LGGIGGILFVVLFLPSHDCAEPFVTYAKGSPSL
jgi:hypothetical protein